MAGATREPEATEVNGAGLFDGQRAMRFLLEQMSFGPRFPGSMGHALAVTHIVQRLSEAGLEVEQQNFIYKGVQGSNVVGRLNVGAGPVIIVGAHYDTRKIADQSPDPSRPVPGAVDGASGVAVLLELANTIERREGGNEIWLAFFDLEDNGRGGIEGWEWIVGSTHMANQLEIVPEAMILVDMIGDADQQLYYEGNSDARLRAELWSIADQLGYSDRFIPELRHTMIDDHVPFARRGIPAVDIIDFDYPYWHTVDDTADKVSVASLEAVGRTVEFWLEHKE